MKTHQDIVRAYGAAALGRDLNEIGLEIHRTTPQRWADRNSIPGDYWAALETLGVATVQELAASADARQRAA
jgi:hypothetical protein